MGGGGGGGRNGVGWGWGRGWDGGVGKGMFGELSSKSFNTPSSFILRFGIVFN